MKIINYEKPVIAGTPLIGEGNIVDNKSFISVLEKAGIPVIGFYPNGPLVRLGRRFHTSISMSTEKAMDYAFSSGIRRSSWRVQPLKWELRRAVKKVFGGSPDAMCFITSQNMMAEEAVGVLGDLPVILASSDVHGKFYHESRPSVRQKEITHVVWNMEALDFYKNGLGLKHVLLTVPLDPKEAFQHIGRDRLPFQEALDEPRLCYIKLSGSGGDPGLVNAAIMSLWQKSRVRSIVFPGTEKTQRGIVKTYGKNVNVDSSLDAAVYYHQIREMISHEQMILTFPSEQVKHISILSQKGIYPKVAWLPPRGQHEVMNLAWAVKKRFSGTICLPVEYQSQLQSRLISLGVKSSEVEFVVPEKLSAEYFKPSPAWQYEADAFPFVYVLNNIA